jgi:GT2 family glycosyltransferase
MLSGESNRISDDISIVIPTLGRAMLRQCLESIAGGQLLPHSIVVVDQSSSDKVRSWLEPLAKLGVGVRYVPSSQTGRAAGVNRGIETVATDYFAITDDDCQVAPDWLLNMRTHLEANPGAVITGRVEAGSDDPVGIVVTSMKQARYERPRLKYDSLCGGNMAASGAVIRRAGLLDEDTVLRCSEDGEWAYRALRSGIPIVYAPDAVIHHYGWREPEERQMQYRLYARSHGAFYGKYLRRGDWFIALRAVTHYLRALRRLVRGVLKGNAEEVRIARAYLVWLIPGVIAGFRSRVGVVKGETVNAR